MTTVWPLTARGSIFERLGRAYADNEIGGVVLTGPAGVGKTRLGEEMLAAAGDRPTARVVGHPATESIPLGALAHLLPFELTADGLPSIDDAPTLFHNARHHLAALGDGRRLLLLVDDADQLDATSHALLLPLTANRTIFLIATLRTGRVLPPVIASLVKDGHLRVEAVSPLSPDDVATLLHRVLDGPIDDRAVMRLAEVSGGNLQILREIVSRSLDVGALRRRDDVWELDQVQTPATLDELVGAQLDLLDPSELSVVEHVAVAGRMSLAMLESITTPGILRDLERRGVIRIVQDDRRTNVTLEHPIYGEIVRHRMSILRRRDIQQVIGDLVQAAGARRREDVTQLALWRLDGGGDVDPNALIRAGRLAALGRDASLARTFADELARRGWVHDGAMIAAEAAGLDADDDEIERIIGGALRDVGLPQHHRAHLSKRLASSRFGRGDLVGAVDALQRAERDVSDAEPQAELRAHRALLLANSGHPLDALQIVSASRAVRDPGARVDLAIAESIACLSVGRFGDAIDAAHRGATAQGELPDWLARRGMASHLLNEAHALTYSGRHREARTLLEDALSRARTSGATAAVVWIEIVLGEVARDTGRGHDAVRHFSAGARQAAAAGQQSALVWAWVGVAQGHLLLGDDVQASSALERADGCESPVATSWATRERTRAWLLACRGELAEARRLIGAVAAAAAADGMWNFEVGVVHDLVRFGEPAAARDRLAQLAAIVEGPSVAAMSLHAEAATDRDADLYEQAIEAFESMDSLVFAAEAALGAADLARRHHDVRTAAALQLRATRLVESAGGARTPALLRPIAVEPLTEREREVAIMAASGTPSKDIAARLFVSKRTVDSHLNNVYRKLAVTGRSELADALSLPRT